MSKVPATTHSIKWLLKFGLATIVGLVGQSVLAACPDAFTINIEDKNVGISGTQTIYFCKQNFPTSALIFAPTETQLLTGGSRAITKGSTAQSFPLNNSVNLAGFNIANLAFNNLSANFPSVNGEFGSPSLFNFYTRVRRQDDCYGNGSNIDQYQLMKSYLRANPSIFQIDSPATSIAGDNSSTTSIAKITGAKLKSAIDPTKQLTATLDLYHANPTSGQFFTASFFNGNRRYCWLGVGARVTIDPNNSNLVYAGNYDLDMSVITQ